jgi:epoxide hydrolase-like predicted phosphatase
MSDVTTTTTRQIDTVIFDLGGVLLSNGRHSDMVRRFPPDKADAALRVFMGDYGADNDHPWHRLERGEISFDEVRRLNRVGLAEIGIELPTPAPAPTPVPAERTSRPMMVFEINTDMVDLVMRLREAGLRTGILTNNVREFRDLWRWLLPYDEIFDDIVDSHEVGMRKPNAAIYELALTRLSAVAGRTAFLDDVLSNVEAAERLGLFGVVVDEDTTPAIAAVERLAGLG